MSQGPLILLSVVLSGLGAATVCVLICRRSARRLLNRINGMWDDVYLHMIKRCEIIRAIIGLLQGISTADLGIVRDLDYLLKKMERTNDVKTHAGIQNGLLLTLQTGIEFCHRGVAESRDEKASGALRNALSQLGAVDSKLIVLRDRHNKAAAFYETAFLPFPLGMLLPRHLRRGRPPFQMMLPWWSTDPAAYGAVSVSELRQAIFQQKLPLVLAPSEETGPRQKRVIPLEEGRPLPNLAASESADAHPRLSG